MRVGFLSTRLAGTDGVTLETAKWAEILERAGHPVFYCAGELDPGCPGRLVPEMHFSHPAVQAVNQSVFDPGQAEAGLRSEIDRLAAGLLREIRRFVADYQIERLIIENALAIPMNIPLGLALYRYLAESRLPSIAHQHDFYWERERFRDCAVPDILEEAFAPRLENVKQVVINSLAQESLVRRRGIKSTRIPNLFDFAAPAPGQAGGNLRAALGLEGRELLILQPTRVIRRKGIELAIEFVRRIREQEPAVLVISHPAGDEGLEYLAELEAQIREAGVPLVYAPGLFGPGRAFDLWAAYRQADFVTYPSLYEGFGNAFLETIYFRRPFLVNRYPVYVADLQPMGFDTIEIDGAVTGAAVEQALEALRDPARLSRMVETNFALGREHFSYEAASPLILGLLDG